jgi:hypothetical protein
MLRYVYGHDEVVAQFVAQLSPHPRGFGKFRAFGVIDEEGKMIAGVVYHNWSPEGRVIEFTPAALPGSRWLTRETIRHMYGYPFDKCGCQMVMKWVRADNEPVLRQLAAFGYMFVRVPRIFGREHDAVLCLYTDDMWRDSKFRRRDADTMKEAA